MTTITALPAAPSRTTDAPATYITKADAMMAALPTFVTETNTVAGEVNTNATTATTQASTATTQATNASNSAAAAAASAVTAVNAPGTNATSTTSLTVGTGSKTLTIQTGKSLVVGMSAKIAYTTTPTTWMHGDITAYDTGTGSLTVYVTAINGSGTQAAWTVSLSPPGGATLGGNTFTGAQNTARATVASHATTADIWGAAGNQIDWTGTATTTAFPAAPQAGAERTLICAAACSFTAGANMLIDGVTSGNTVTCAANDTVIVRAMTTTQFKLSRVKYDGTPQVSPPSGAWKYLSTVSASNSATVDVETTFDSTYAAYVIVASDIHVQNSGVVFLCRFKVGGAYDAGPNYYFHTNQARASLSTYNASTGNPDTYIKIFSDGIGNGSADSGDFTLFLHNPSSTAIYKKCYWNAVATNGTNFYQGLGIGGNTSTSALTGVRFYAVSGNIVSGNFRLYGISNS